MEDWSAKFYQNSIDYKLYLCVGLRKRRRELIARFKYYLAIIWVNLIYCAKKIIKSYPFIVNISIQYDVKTIIGLE